MGILNGFERRLRQAGVNLGLVEDPGVREVCNQIVRRERPLDGVGSDARFLVERYRRYTRVRTVPPPGKELCPGFMEEASFRVERDGRGSSGPVVVRKEGTLVITVASLYSSLAEARSRRKPKG